MSSLEASKRSRRASNVSQRRSIISSFREQTAGLTSQTYGSRTTLRRRHTRTRQPHSHQRTSTKHNKQVTGYDGRLRQALTETDLEVLGSNSCCACCCRTRQTPTNTLPDTKVEQGSLAVRTDEKDNVATTASTSSDEQQHGNQYAEGCPGMAKEPSASSDCCGCVCWQRVTFPSVLDLVGDQTKSKMLNVAIFLMVVTFVGAVLLTAVLKDTLNTGETIEIELAYLPSGPVRFVSGYQQGVLAPERVPDADTNPNFVSFTPSKPVLVRLKNSRGFAADDTSIEPALIAYQPVSSVQAFCNNWDSGTLWSMESFHACLPLFRNVDARTDRDGIARLRQFDVATGAPGLYRLRFSCVNKRYREQLNDVLLRSGRREGGSISFLDPQYYKNPAPYTTDSYNNDDKPFEGWGIINNEATSVLPFWVATMKDSKHIQDRKMDWDERDQDSITYINTTRQAVNTRIDNILYYDPMKNHDRTNNKRVWFTPERYTDTDEDRLKDITSAGDCDPSNVYADISVQIRSNVFRIEFFPNIIWESILQEYVEFNRQYLKQGMVLRFRVLSVQSNPNTREKLPAIGRHVVMYGQRIPTDVKDDLVLVGEEPLDAFDPDKAVVLAGNRAVTDMNGVASFPDLRILGWNRRTILLNVYCEGVTLLDEAQSAEPFDIPSAVHAVEIIKRPPRVVKEGKLFTAMVRVTDKYGRGLRNRYVFAEVTAVINKFALFAYMESLDVPATIEKKNATGFYGVFNGTEYINFGPELDEILTWIDFPIGIQSRVNQSTYKTLLQRTKREVLSMPNYRSCAPKNHDELLGEDFSVFDDHHCRNYSNNFYMYDENGAYTGDDVEMEDVVVVTTGPVSLATDEDGYALFPALSWSYKGYISAYKIAFNCETVWSREVAMLVQTSVDRIVYQIPSSWSSLSECEAEKLGGNVDPEYLFKREDRDNIGKGQKDLGVIVRKLRMNFSIPLVDQRQYTPSGMLPYFQLLDEHDQPVRGKSVAIYDGRVSAVYETVESFMQDPANYEIIFRGDLGANNATNSSDLWIPVEAMINSQQIVSVKHKSAPSDHKGYIYMEELSFEIKSYSDFAKQETRSSNHTECYSREGDLLTDFGTREYNFIPMHFMILADTVALVGGPELRVENSFDTIANVSTSNTVFFNRQNNATLDAILSANSTKEAQYFQSIKQSLISNVAKTVASIEWIDMPSHQVFAAQPETMRVRVWDVYGQPATGVPVCMRAEAAGAVPVFLWGNRLANISRYLTYAQAIQSANDTNKQLGSSTCGVKLFDILGTYLGVSSSYNYTKYLCAGESSQFITPCRYTDSEGIAELCFINLAQFTYNMTMSITMYAPNIPLGTFSLAEDQLTSVIVNSLQREDYKERVDSTPLYFSMLGAGEQDKLKVIPLSIDLAENDESYYNVNEINKTAADAADEVYHERSRRLSRIHYSKNTVPFPSNGNAVDIDGNATELPEVYSYLLDPWDSIAVNVSGAISFYDRGANDTSNNLYSNIDDIDPSDYPNISAFKPFVTARVIQSPDYIGGIGLVTSKLFDPLFKRAGHELPFDFTPGFCTMGKSDAVGVLANVSGVAEVKVTATQGYPGKYQLVFGDETRTLFSRVITIKQEQRAAYLTITRQWPTPKCINGSSINASYVGNLTHFPPVNDTECTYFNVGLQLALPSDYQPCIRVTDKYGNPLRGMTVAARLNRVLQKAKGGVYANSNENSAGQLVTDPSDEDGLACFDHFGIDTGVGGEIHQVAFFMHNPTFDAPKLNVFSNPFQIHGFSELTITALNPPPSFASIGSVFEAPMLFSLHVRNSPSADNTAVDGRVLPFVSWNKTGAEIFSAAMRIACVGFDRDLDTEISGINGPICGGTTAGVTRLVTVPTLTSIVETLSSDLAAYGLTRGDLVAVIDTTHVVPEGKIPFRVSDETSFDINTAPHAIFPQFLFESGQSNAAAMILVSIGSVEARFGPVVINSQIGRLEVSGTPEHIQVGNYVNLVVTVYSKFGGALQNQAVNTRIYKNAGRGKLDSTTISGFSDATGRAFMQISFAEASPDVKGSAGVFSLQFESGGVRSQPTKSFAVFNPITTDAVTFLTQPAAADGISVDIRDSLESNRASLRQPVIKVARSNGIALSNIPIEVSLVTAKTRTALARGLSFDNSKRTNAKGIYEFDDITLLEEVDSGSYRLRFNILGVYVYSEAFEVKNHLKIDPSALDDFKTAVYIMMALLLPLFLATASVYKGVSLLLVGMVVVVVYMIVGVVYVVLAFESEGDTIDPFGFILRLALIINLFVILVLFGFLLVASCLRAANTARPLLDERQSQGDGGESDTSSTDDDESKLRQRHRGGGGVCCVCVQSMYTTVIGWCRGCVYCCVRDDDETSTFHHPGKNGSGVPYHELNHLPQDSNMPLDEFEPQKGATGGVGGALFSEHQVRAYPLFQSGAHVSSTPRGHRSNNPPPPPPQPPIMNSDQTVTNVGASNSVDASASDDSDDGYEAMVASGTNVASDDAKDEVPMGLTVSLDETPHAYNNTVSWEHRRERLNQPSSPSSPQVHRMFTRMSIIDPFHRARKEQDTPTGILSHDRFLPLARQRYSYVPIRCDLARFAHHSYRYVCQQPTHAVRCDLRQGHGCSTNKDCTDADAGGKPCYHARLVDMYTGEPVPTSRLGVRTALPIAQKFLMTYYERRFYEYSYFCLTAGRPSFLGEVIRHLRVQIVREHIYKLWSLENAFDYLDFVTFFTRPEFRRTRRAQSLQNIGSTPNPNNSDDSDSEVEGESCGCRKRLGRCCWRVARFVMVLFDECLGGSSATGSRKKKSKSHRSGLSIRQRDAAMDSDEDSDEYPEYADEESTSGPSKAGSAFDNYMAWSYEALYRELKELSAPRARVLAKLLHRKSPFIDNHQAGSVGQKGPTWLSFAAKLDSNSDSGTETSHPNHSCCARLGNWICCGPSLSTGTHRNDMEVDAGMNLAPLMLGKYTTLRIYGNCVMLPEGVEACIARQVKLSDGTTDYRYEEDAKTLSRAILCPDLSIARDKYIRRPKRWYDAVGGGSGGGGGGGGQNTPVDHTGPSAHTDAIRLPAHLTHPLEASRPVAQYDYHPTDQELETFPFSREMAAALHKRVVEVWNSAVPLEVVHSVVGIRNEPVFSAPNPGNNPHNNPNSTQAGAAGVMSLDALNASGRDELFSRYAIENARADATDTPTSYTDHVAVQAFVSGGNGGVNSGGSGGGGGVNSGGSGSSGGVNSGGNDGLLVNMIRDIDASKSHPQSAPPPPPPPQPHIQTPVFAQQNTRNSAPVIASVLVKQPIDASQLEKTSTTLFFPQRLLFGLYLTLLMIFFSLLGVTSLVKYVVRLFEKARVYTVDLQMRYNRFQDTSGAVTELAAVLEGSFDAVDIPTDSATGATLDGYLNGGETKFVSMMGMFWELIGEVDGRTVDLIAQRTLICGVLASVIAYIFVGFAWVKILGSYRHDVRRSRRGDWARFGGWDGRKGFSLGSASPLPGLIVWRGFMSFVSVFFIMFVFTFFISWPWFWEFIWEYAKPFLISVGILWVALKLLVTIIKMLIVRRTYIGSRRLYDVLDLGLTFVSFGSGFLSGLIQFGVAVVFLFLQFSRIDQQNFPMDGGFTAYASMLRQDIEHTHPIVMIFRRLIKDQIIMAMTQTKRLVNFTRRQKSMAKQTDQRKVEVTGGNVKRTSLFSQAPSQSGPGYVDKNGLVCIEMDTLKASQKPEQEKMTGNVCLSDVREASMEPARYQLAAFRLQCLYTGLCNPDILTDTTIAHRKGRFSQMYQNGGEDDVNNKNNKDNNNDNGDTDSNDNRGAQASMPWARLHQRTHFGGWSTLLSHRQERDRQSSLVTDERDHWDLDFSVTKGSTDVWLGRMRDRAYSNAAGGDVLLPRRARAYTSANVSSDLVSGKTPMGPMGRSRGYTSASGGRHGKKHVTGHTGSPPPGDVYEQYIRNDAYAHNDGYTRNDEYGRSEGDSLSGGFVGGDDEYGEQYEHAGSSRPRLATLGDVQVKIMDEPNVLMGGHGTNVVSDSEMTASEED